MSILGDSKIDFGRPTGILNLWGGRLTQRVDLRVLTVSGLVVLIAVAVALETIVAPSGVRGVHCLPKAGQALGFMRPRSTSPL